MRSPENRWGRLRPRWRARGIRTVAALLVTGMITTAAASVALGANDFGTLAVDTGGPQLRGSGGGGAGQDTRPTLTVAVGEEKRLVRAMYVDCGARSCPGGVIPKTRCPFVLAAGRMLRLNTHEAARSVDILIRRRTRSGRTLTLVNRPARRRGESQHLWRLKLPSRMRGARELQVRVAYVEGPGAAFGLRVSPRARCGHRTR